jgi:hypothetical protein
MRTCSKLVAAGVIALGAPLLAGAATAAPLSGPRALATADAAAAPVQTVQWRRGWGGGWRGGWRGGWGGGRWIGPAAGIAAGVAIGSALAGPYYYGGYGPGYYGPGYDEYAYEPYAAAPAGGDVAYCEQRFRSYDPASGTYLGYDGRRHPCP